MLSWTRCISARTSVERPCPCCARGQARQLQEIVGSRTATSAPCGTWSGLERTQLFGSTTLCIRACGGSPNVRAPVPRRSAHRPLRPVEGPDCPSRCSQPREGCSRRSDHIGDSAGNTRLCSTSRRTSISRWHACVHPVLLVNGWLALPRWPARPPKGEWCRSARPLRTLTAAFLHRSRPRNTRFVPPRRPSPLSARSGSESSPRCSRRASGTSHSHRAKGL